MGFVSKSDQHTATTWPLAVLKETGLMKWAARHRRFAPRSLAGLPLPQRCAAWYSPSALNGAILTASPLATSWPWTLGCSTPGKKKTVSKIKILFTSHYILILSQD